MEQSEMEGGALLAAGRDGNPVEVCIELVEGGRMPVKARPDDAAYDLFANETVAVPPLGTALVSAGFRISLPRGYEAQVRPRSGNALKRHLHIANSPGTIDCGYSGVVGVIVYNSSANDLLVVRDGERVAQMVVSKLPEVALVERKIDRGTERGEGGFGSTGMVGNG